MDDNHQQALHEALAAAGFLFPYNMMPAQSTAATTVAPPGPPTGTRLATTYANSSSAAATPARAVKVPAPAKTKAAQMDAEVEHLQQMAVRAPRVPANGSSTAVLKSLTQTEEEVINDIRGFCAPGSPVENQVPKLFNCCALLSCQRHCLTCPTLSNQLILT